MEPFSGVTQIEALKNLLDPEGSDDDEASYVSGSVLNPGTVTGESGEKEIAKPYAKVEAKVFRRTVGDTALKEQDPHQAQEEENKKKELIQKKEREKDTAIWGEKEIQEFQQKDKREGRDEPYYEVLHKQYVGTEDIYLGMSGKDPSTVNCDSLLVKVRLPDTEFKQIALDVQSQTITVQTPKYYLNHILPYPVEKEKGNAKWESDKHMLLVTLPAKKKNIFDEF